MLLSVSVHVFGETGERSDLGAGSTRVEAGLGCVSAGCPLTMFGRLAPAALDLFAQGKRTCRSGGQMSPEGDPVALGRGKQNWLQELEKDLCGPGAWCSRSLTASSSTNEDLRDT